MTNNQKKNGTYDGRTNEGRASKGKTNAPKATIDKMEKASKNTKKFGK